MSLITVLLSLFPNLCVWPHVIRYLRNGHVQGWKRVTGFTLFLWILRHWPPPSMPVTPSLLGLVRPKISTTPGLLNQRSCHLCSISARHLVRHKLLMLKEKLTLMSCWSVGNIYPKCCLGNWSGQVVLEMNTVTDSYRLHVDLNMC